MTVFNNAEQAFNSYFVKIMKSGIDRKGNKALFNECFKLLYPNENLITTPWRRWNEQYAALEYEWYKTGNPDPAMVVEQAKLWNQMKDADGLVNSNYGMFWKQNNQLEKIKNILSDDEFTRRAVVVHYDINKIDGYGNDTPCNLVLNFYVVSGFLHMTIFARSIDLVYGFCNDQYTLSRLMMDVADEFGYSVGYLTYMITNLHIYEKHYYINERR